jgi:transposase InsO family protein
MLADDYPIRLLCHTLDVAPSSLYYRRRERDEEALRVALLRLAGEWPTFGRPRLTAMLRREGFVVNHKRVGRLMRELGLLAQRPVHKKRTTNSDHAFPRWPNLVEGRKVEQPDEVWVADIPYVRLQTEFVYLAVLMDVFTRSIGGWHLHRNLDADLTLVALRRALATNTPQIHHSDQGVQYASTAYVNVLQGAGIKISMAAVGEPTQNAHAERLMRTIQEEHVDLSEYQDYADAYRQIGRFLEEVYQHKRIHSSLGYLTPAEFESQWLKEQAQKALIIL